MLRLNLQLFSSKEGMESSKSDRDSESKRLGLKKGGGQYVLAGSVLVCQRRTKTHSGENVSRGSDDTLFATANGIVKFERKGRGMKKVVSVEAKELA